MSTALCLAVREPCESITMPYSSDSTGRSGTPGSVDVNEIQPRVRGDSTDGFEAPDQIIDGLQQELASLRGELERSDRLATLGVYAASVAHELNNLLTPILSYAQLARREPDDEELARKAIERAEAGAARAAEIVQAVLGFTRGDEDRAERPSKRLSAAETGSSDASQVSPTASVHSCLDSALSCMARPPTKDGIKLERRIDSDAIAAIRPIALEQILMNTIANALDALRSRRGTISVVARCSTWNSIASSDQSPDTRSTCWVGDSIGLDSSRAKRTPSNMVVLEVIDNGPGIPSSLLARVFHPLVTGKRNMPNTDTGYGLGLTICRRAVHDAGGLIRLASQEGCGTTVQIILPHANG